MVPRPATKAAAVAAAAKTKAEAAASAADIAQAAAEENAVASAKVTAEATEMSAAPPQSDAPNHLVRAVASRDDLDVVGAEMFNAMTAPNPHVTSSGLDDGIGATPRAVVPTDGAVDALPAASTLPAADSGGGEVTCECSKCKWQKPVENGFAARAGTSFVCKQCNCKRSTASQIFGAWPISLFAMLPESQQIEFWRDGGKGAQMIQRALVKEISEQRLEEERTSVGGQYLPRSVLKTQGYTDADIDACDDTEEHKTLGTVYNMNIKTKSKDEVTRKVWKDLFSNSGKAKDKKKKKKTNKQKRKASSASSSSNDESSSSSSSDGKKTPVQIRQEAAAKRKEELAAEKQVKKESKEAELAKARAAAAESKARGLEARLRQKEAVNQQALYSTLFSAHSALAMDLSLVPFDKHSEDKCKEAMETQARAEVLLAECLELMKAKASLDKEDVKAQTKACRLAQNEAVKLQSQKKTKKR
jgi:hypothetical protein